MSSVLITGCSKGIGRALVAELVSRGHEVIATARRPESLAGLPVERRLALDVTDDESVRRAVAEAGPVDVVVNNAGEIFHGPAEYIPIERIQWLLDVNTVGALRVTQAALPEMRARGRGRIVFMSSWSARVAFPFLGAYCATKWALEAIAEALALEVASFGISVVMLEPGMVSSGVHDVPRRFDGDGVYDEIIKRNARDRSMITPGEVARAAADAIESPAPALRIPVGPAADSLLALRRSSDDRMPFTFNPPPGRPGNAR
jgi:NAD(P)-dependent dehydrogenase (short-subunit alcohol dehydrogenase family)